MNTLTGWGFTPDGLERYLAPPAPTEPAKTFRQGHWVGQAEIEEYAATLTAAPTSAEIVERFGCHPSSASRYRTRLLDAMAKLKGIG